MIIRPLCSLINTSISESASLNSTNMNINHFVCTFIQTNVSSSSVRSHGCADIIKVFIIIIITDLQLVTLFQIRKPKQWFKVYHIFNTFTWKKHNTWWKWFVPQQQNETVTILHRFDDNKTLLSFLTPDFIHLILCGLYCWFCWETSDNNNLRGHE